MQNFLLMPKYLAEILKSMSELSRNQEQLKAAIAELKVLAASERSAYMAAVKAAVDAGTAELLVKIADLEAKLVAGQDFSVELALVQEAATEIQSIVE